MMSRCSKMPVPQTFSSSSSKLRNSPFARISVSSVVYSRADSASGCLPLR